MPVYRCFVYIVVFVCRRNRSHTKLRHIPLLKVHSGEFTWLYNCFLSLHKTRLNHFETGFTQLWIIRYSNQIVISLMSFKQWVISCWSHAIQDIGNGVAEKRKYFILYTNHTGASTSMVSFTRRFLADCALLFANLGTFRNYFLFLHLIIYIHDETSWNG